jgi:hypothetical protein
MGSMPGRPELEPIAVDGKPRLSAALAAVSGQQAQEHAGQRPALIEHLSNLHLRPPKLVS